VPRAIRLGAPLALVLALAAGVALAAKAPAPALRNWPEFGLNAQRTNSAAASPGITAANVSHLRSRTVTLPGTVDSSPIYLHGVAIRGARHDAIFVTTTYGITLAIDAGSGRILWRFTPPGIKSWSGSAQITTASPIADPGRAFVYATSPNGEVHRLSVADGREQSGWPAKITTDPTHEKLTASLNIAGAELLASTGGYIGDIPPYIGHVVAIDRADGHIRAVFNTLCSNRRQIVAASTCSASDSAILSRSGPVVEPGGKRVLVATGNAPYNGRTDFGDSVIELTLPNLAFRQAYTPTDQVRLNSSDLDLGSGSPAVLPGHLAWIAGKDGIQRLLNLAALDGSPPSKPQHTGGDVQDLPTPGNQMVFTAPAVDGKLLFVTDGGGTIAYRLAGRRLHELWSNGTAGTSPILVGGLLYVYNPGGSLVVYRPASGHIVATLSVPSGHWNSPIAVDGHLVVPSGDANDHSTSGTLTIFSVR
jgi:outer membrane protein assembly factor BamB